MKKLFKYALIASCALTTTACSDFLEEENKSNITAETYFNSASGYESLANAAYSSLRSVWGKDPWLYCLGVDIYTRGESELRNGSYESRDIYSRQLNEYADLDSQNGFVSSFYSTFYKAIQICNTAIAYADIAPLEEGRKNQLVSEVRSIRAYYYFLLVEQFGGIPIVTDEITTPITHFERNSEEEVYNFILTELDDVVNKLPVTSAEFGRVNRFVVKNLQSLVYLTRGYKPFGDKGDFQAAATLADEVINCGYYQLLPDFADVFDSDNQENKEIIWSVQYDANSLSHPSEGGNGQNVHFGWPVWSKIQGGFEWVNTVYNCRLQQFTPTQFLYSLFDTHIDGRYEATFLSRYYATVDAPNVGVKKGDLRVYFPIYDQPLAKEDSLGLMKNNPNVIIVNKERWKPDIDGVGGSGIFPMVNKFYDPDALFPGSNSKYASTRDIYLFRLAETYLIAAEAYLKTGDAAKATERINQVRTRAALPGMEERMRVETKDVSIDLILDERARELVGEYKRWPDLKRTGKLIERTLKHNIMVASSGKMDEHLLLRPIPQTVIDQDSGEFSQNPGYN